MRRLQVALVLAGVLVAATPAGAGWIIDEVVRGTGDSRERQRLYLQNNRMKTVSLEGNRVTTAVVMDLDAQTITHIDYQERAYTTATAREYADMVRQGFEKMGEAMGQMQSQKPQAPARLKPEDCAPDKVAVKSTGTHATVAGYDASGYQIFANGTLDSEVWIAPAITAAREIDPQKLERMVSEMLRALPQCPPRGQMFGADLVWKLMKNGYPVRTIEKDGGRVIEVVKAESRSLGAGEFEAPAGFARKALKDMMGGK